MTCFTADRTTKTRLHCWDKILLFVCLFHICVISVIYPPAPIDPIRRPGCTQRTGHELCERCTHFSESRVIAIPLPGFTRITLERPPTFVSCGKQQKACTVVVSSASLTSASPRI